MKQIKPKKDYQKPVMKKENSMNFPIEIMSNGKSIVCRGCSSCHGCR